MRLVITGGNIGTTHTDVVQRQSKDVTAFSFRNDIAKHTGGQTPCVSAIVVPQPSKRNLTISTKPLILQPIKPPQTNSRMTIAIKPMNVSISIYTTIAKTTNS